MSYFKFKDYRANSLDPNEVALDEPPHQDVLCLQILFFFFPFFGTLWVKMVPRMLVVPQVPLITQSFVPVS